MSATASGAAAGGEGASRGPLLLAGALFALVVATAILLLGRTAERGAFVEEYSTFRAAPGGAKAAYLVLERLGHRVRRHTEDLVALEGTDVLFVLEPTVAGLGLFSQLIEEKELRALDLFVRNGGCLVVASSIETPLHAAFGVRLLTTTPTATPAADDEAEDETPEAAPPSTRTALVVPAFPSVYTAGVRAVHPDVHGRSLASETPTAVPLLLQEGGGAEALLVGRGAGRALFFADPSVFANRALARGDGAVLVAAIAAAESRGGAVAFDEGHHGFRTERGVTGYLGRRSLAPAVVQAGLALLVLGLALGGRRGRPPLLSEERPPESIEHIRAMAEIYAKARLRLHAAERLYGGLVRDVEGALGFTPTVRAGEVEDAAARGVVRDGPVAEALRERGVAGFRMLETISARVRRLAAARDPRRISEAELLHLSREIGRFEAECRRALGHRFGEVRGA